MILNIIVYFLFYGVISLVNLVLYPIQVLINSYVPALNTMLTAVNSLMTLITGTFVYVVSLSLLSHLALSFIVVYYSFALVFPMLAWSIKVPIKWFHKLKT